MIDRDGQMFYTSADVNHGKVRDAMKEAGNRTEALPLDQLGHGGYRRRRAAHLASLERRGHQYGPHRPEDAPATVTILGPGKWPKAIEVPPARALVKQREHINRLAHQRGTR